MPNELPAFLQEFMNHRKNVTKSDLSSPAVKKSQSLQPAKGLADIELGIGAIIDKQPKNKVVKQFLETRVEELSKIKMK